MQDLHTLAGAYALDALSDTERRRFEVHLIDCETCPPEVRGLRETAARLALAVSETAPAGLRERVLAEAAVTRQLPPRIAEHEPRRKRGVSWILAAACLLLAVVLGGVAISSDHRASRAEALNRQVAAVLSAPDARAMTATARPTGNGTVVSSHTLGKMVMFMSGLSVPPAGKVYEAWWLGPGVARPAGLMKASGDGTPKPVIASDRGDATQVGITVEPAGGSAQPTTTPVFTVQLQ